MGLCIQHCQNNNTKKYNLPFLPFTLSEPSVTSKPFLTFFVCNRTSTNEKKICQIPCTTRLLWDPKHSGIGGPISGTKCQKNCLKIFLFPPFFLQNPVAHGERSPAPPPCGDGGEEWEVEVGEEAEGGDCAATQFSL